MARMQNSNYKKIDRLPVSRKIHVAAWGHPSDPSVYCRIDLDVTPVLKYLKKLREKTGEKITINHFVAKVIGYCLEKFPETNHILIKNSFYRRPNISLYFMTHVDTPHGHDIAGFLIQDIDRKSLAKVASIIRDKSQAIRSGKDKETEDTRRIVKKIPSWVFPWLFKFLDFLVYVLNLDLSGLGYSKNQCGGATLSATGSLGLEVTYVPLSHFSRCPLIFTVGKVRKMPVVANEQLAIGDVSTITFTYDHRYIDGAHSADIQNLFKDVFNNPENYTDVFE